MNTDRIFLGILIILAFLWRFLRTRQIYLTSLSVHDQGSEPILFHPHDARSFVDQALLGRRSLAPSSFFVRAIVFALVAIGLLPFKDYEPVLFWLVVALITLYVPWCVSYGYKLNKHFAKSQSI
jgi:hypothetical protein